MNEFDMDPDGMTHGINQFRSAGEDFGTAWEKQKQALEAAVSGLGNDSIAQAILAKYQPLAKALADHADAIPKTWANLCDDMQSCVSDYNAADTSGAGTMNGVASSGMGDAPTPS